MATDKDLPITGKDASIEIIVDGIPVKITDKTTKFTREAQYDTTEVKHLGTSEVDIDPEPIGWAGTIEVSVVNGDLDAVLDANRILRANRVPTLLLISETIRYRDGTSRTYIYPDIKIVGESMDHARAQATSIRLSWKTGKQRI